MHLSNDNLCTESVNDMKGPGKHNLLNRSPYKVSKTHLIILSVCLKENKPRSISHLNLNLKFDWIKTGCLMMLRIKYRNVTHGQFQNVSQV